jgi:hypothetical protein
MGGIKGKINETEAIIINSGIIWGIGIFSYISPIKAGAVKVKVNDQAGDSYPPKEYKDRR